MYVFVCCFYGITIFCVFASFPSIRRNTYTPAVIPSVETRFIASPERMTRPVTSKICNVALAGASVMTMSPSLMKAKASEPVERPFSLLALNASLKREV